MGARRSGDVDGTAATLASDPGEAPTVAAAPSATPTVAMRKTPASPSSPPGGATISTDGAPPEAAPARAFAADWSERGRYALVAELARGGGGRIAIAVDRKLGRKVALKRPLDRDGEERLEREALVLARLEHPAIVPIHDAGHDAEGNPYYTMKLLGGATLAERIADATTFDRRLALLPSVTTVADACAYAHSQGVIHRDLKPGNVLVGEFGEVALIDWGLGKIIGEPGLRGGAPPIGPIGSRGDLVSADLTGHGAVIGTPAYMAPEQAIGEAVDARADVYALGAMLYHVLTGDVPYGRSGTQETLLRLVEGPPPPIEEREPRVPRDLAAIVNHAMARDAGARYPSARELALDLHRYQTGKLVAAHRYKLRTRAWRWARRHQAALAASVAAVALGVAGVAIAERRAAAPDETCAGLEAPVRAVWNADVRAAGARAFVATGLPFAAPTWRAVSAALDQRAGAIATMRVAACRAARVTGVETAQVMDLRMQCLDRRTAELHVLAGVFAQADRKVVQHAEQALGGLGRVEDCADVARLRDAVPLPEDPRRRAEIQAVQAELDRLQALDVAGKYAEMAGAIAPASMRALATGYPPVLSRATMRWAGILGDAGDDDASEALYRLTVATADRSRDDVTRGRALDGLIRIEADHRARYDVAEEYARAALAVAERTGDDNLASEVDIYLSHIAAATGHHPDAVFYDQRALDRQRRIHGPLLDRALYDLGSEYADQQRWAEAEPLLRDAVAEMRRAYGTDVHPNVANALTNLAAVLYGKGDADAAIALQRHVVELYDRVLPPSSQGSISGHQVLAQMLDETGHHAEAEAALRELLASTEARLGKGHPACVEITLLLAEALRKEARWDDAIATYRDSQARAAAIDPGGLDVAKARAALGGLFVERARAKEAVVELEAALAVIDRAPPPGPLAAMTRADLGRAVLDLGDARRAEAELRRALPGLDESAEAAERGMMRTALAQALWQEGRRDEAKQVAAEARALVESDPSADAPRQELDAWERAVGVTTRGPR